MADEEEDNSGVMATIGRGQPKPDEAEKNNTPEPEEKKDPKVEAAQKEKDSSKTSDVLRIKKGAPLFGTTPKDASYQTLVDNLIKSGQLIVEEADQNVKGVSKKAAVNESKSGVSKKLTQISKKLSLLNNSLTRLFRITESIKGLLGDQLKWEKKRYEQIEIWKQEQSLLSPKGKDGADDGEEEEDKKKKNGSNLSLLAALMLLPAFIGFAAYIGDQRQSLSIFLLRHLKNIRTLYNMTKTAISGGAKALMRNVGLMKPERYRTLKNGSIIDNETGKFTSKEKIAKQEAEAAKSKGIQKGYKYNEATGRYHQVNEETGKTGKMVSEAEAKTSNFGKSIQKISTSIKESNAGKAVKAVGEFTGASSVVRGVASGVSKVSKVGSQAMTIIKYLKSVKGFITKNPMMERIKGPLGKIILALTFSIDVIIDIFSEGKGEKYWRPLIVDVSKALGAIFGAFLSFFFEKGIETLSTYLGGLIGSILPGPGTIIGAFIGDALGLIISGVIDYYGSKFFEFLGGYLADKLCEAIFDGKNASELISEIGMDITKWGEKAVGKKVTAVTTSVAKTLFNLSPIGMAFNAAKYLGQTNTGRSVLTKIGLDKFFAPSRVAPITGMDDVKKMIIRHEGWKNKAYKDSLGKWTIGVGHLIGDGSSPGEYEGRTLSNNEIWNLFEQDFATHVNLAKKTPGYDKANIQGKAAMVDLAYNMGQWWDKWPNTAKKLIAADFKGAAEDLQNSKWYTQVGQRGAEIVSMIASAGAAISPISSAKASPAVGPPAAMEQKSATPAAAAPPASPQIPGASKGSSAQPAAGGDGKAMPQPQGNPADKRKYAQQGTQYHIPDPAHQSFMDDLVSVMFNANDPAMGVIGL